MLLLILFWRSLFCGLRLRLWCRFLIKRSLNRPKKIAWKFLSRRLCTTRVELSRLGARNYTEPPNYSTKIRSTIWSKTVWNPINPVAFLLLLAESNFSYADSMYFGSTLFVQTIFYSSEYFETTPVVPLQLPVTLLCNQTLRILTPGVSEWVSQNILELFEIFGIFGVSECHQKSPNISNIYSYKQPSSPCWRGLASPWPSLFLQRCSFQPERTPSCRPDPAYSPSAWYP